MKLLTVLSLLLVAAMVAPLVHAGDAASPEMIDAAGDAPSQVDVVAAWFQAPPAPAARTGVKECLPRAPVVGIQCRDVDCELAECAQAVGIHVQLRDPVLASQPLADNDPASVRYYFYISFKPSNLDKVVKLLCVIHFAEAGRSGYEYFLTYGRRCTYDDPFMPYEGPYEIVQQGGLSTGNSFSLLLRGNLPDGTVLSDLAVTSAIERVRTFEPGHPLQVFLPPAVADLTETPGRGYQHVNTHLR